MKFITHYTFLRSFCFSFPNLVTITLINQNSINSNIQRLYYQRTHYKSIYMIHSPPRCFQKNSVFRRYVPRIFSFKKHRAIIFLQHLNFVIIIIKLFITPWRIKKIITINNSGIYLFCFQVIYFFNSEAQMSFCQEMYYRTSLMVYNRQNF